MEDIQWGPGMAPASQVTLGAGAVTLHRGDALHVLTALDPESVDHVFTDPPYSTGGVWARTRTQSTAEKYGFYDNAQGYPEFMGDARDQRSFLHWCTLWGSLCFRAMRPGGVFAVFTDWRQLAQMTDALQAAGFVFRGIVVWDKTEGARPDPGQYRRQSEFVVWGTKGPVRRYAGAPCLPGVFRHPVKRSDKFHMTGKPSALMADLLRIVRPGDTVLDPFMGSGTTGTEALRRGCRFVGVEQAPNIFAGAAARISAVVDAAAA